MIDLSKDLPNTIMVDGKSYLVNTDFKVWLGFNIAIENDELTVNDLAKLFVNDIANIFVNVSSQENLIKAIMQFLTNPNNIPRYDNGNERATDYLEDSEYIYASFMDAYGIDLCNTEMHWHQFKALLLGLPDNSRYKQILAMRCADLKDSKKKPEDIARENKRAWALPLSKKEKEEAEKKERRIAELLGEI